MDLRVTGFRVSGFGSTESAASSSLLGPTHVKVNVVVVRGVNDMEIADFVALTESMVRLHCGT